MRGTALHIPRSLQKEGPGGAPGVRADIALWPMVRAMVRQAMLCSPWQATGMQRPTCRPWSRPTQVGTYRRPRLKQVPGRDLWTRGGRSP